MQKGIKRATMEIIKQIGGMSMYYLHPYGGEYEQEFGEKGVEDVERLLQEGIVKVFIENVYVASKEKYLTKESHLTVLEELRSYFDDYKIGNITIGEEEIFSYMLDFIWDDEEEEKIVNASDGDKAMKDLYVRSKNGVLQSYIDIFTEDIED